MKGKQKKKLLVEPPSFNPLANYELQITPNIKHREKRIGDTSLREDTRLNYVGYENESKFYVNEDMGAFDYSKLISSAANRKLILSLKPSAQSLFLWILYELDYKSDTIEVSLARVNKTKFKIVAASLRDAIEELEHHCIIKRIGNKRTSDYWRFFINPQVIFKGDAKQFYKDVIFYHPEYMKM